jgi:DsbC/DsbD-like thiol-disulfide interchange protein
VHRLSTLALLASLSSPIACTTREPASSEPAKTEAPAPRDQRVALELARVPDSLAKPVIAELGLDATGLIAARHRIDPDWHIYWRNPGSAGLPTTLTSTPIEGSTLVVGEAILPAPDRFEDAYGWEHEAILFIPIRAGEGDLSVRSTWVACQAEACVAGENQATLAASEASPDDPVLRAMLARIPRPLGDRLASHAWSKTDDRVMLELVLSADASAIEFFPDASDPALFFVDARFDAGARTLTIAWRPGSAGHRLPPDQGVLAWTDASGTHHHALALPWPS